MHPALKHALHHWTMSLHASISLNSGFRSMPLPDEIAVRLPPPPSLSLQKGGRSTGGRAGEALAYLEGRVTSTRSPCGRCGGLPASVRLPPPSASVSHSTYMQGCVHAFLVQSCLCAECCDKHVVWCVIGPPSGWHIRRVQLSLDPRDFNYHP